MTSKYFQQYHKKKYVYLFVFIFKNDSYCRRGDANRKCRFGFPKPYTPVTVLEEDQRCVYKRGVADAMVNNYNPYLLSVFRTSMDIQYNCGPQAVRYLAKYLAKDDYQTKVMLKSIRKSGEGYYQKSSYISDTEHYKTRIVGAVEATYDIMGWHKHRNSRNVLFLNTGLINHDSRRLRDDIKELDENSSDIFAKTHIQIYEKRNGARTLTMPEFYCFYNRGGGSSNSNNTGDNDSNDRAEDGGEGQEIRDFYPNQNLPKTVSSGRVDYVLRSKKRAYWRTFNQSEMNGESYYYQQIVTKKAIFNTTFEEAKGMYHTWKDYYSHLISIPVEEGGIPVHDRVNNIRSVDDVSETNRGDAVTKQELKILYRKANVDQKSIYAMIKSELVVNSTSFVSGAAGTGKSFVLRMLERYYRLKGFKVIPFVYFLLHFFYCTITNFFLI